MDENAPSDQRPFHICPECSAYNAKFNKACWRCDHDMTTSAVEPQGVIGFRLAELDESSKPKDSQS